MKTFLFWLSLTLGGTITLLSYVMLNMDQIHIGEVDLYSYLVSIFPSPQKPPPGEMRNHIQKVRSVFSSARTKYLEKIVFYFRPSLELVRWKDIQIPVDHGVDEITLRLYNYGKKDNSLPSDSNRKVLLFFHGGGWIVGSRINSHLLTVQLAEETGYLVVSVDYRLAPEHVFPTAINDSYAALEWVLEHIEEYGGDREQVIIAGESAGGNLAAAVTSRYLVAEVNRMCTASSEDPRSSYHLCDRIVQLEARRERWHRLSGLWLAYPPLNVTSLTPEAMAMDRYNPFLTVTMMETMRKLYQSGTEEVDMDETIRSHYWFSPALTPTEILSLYPPTLFTFAKFDPLLYEGLEFFEKLTAVSHHSVEKMLYNHTIHGFVTSYPTLGMKAAKHVANYMKDHFL